MPTNDLMTNGALGVALMLSVGAATEGSGRDAARTGLELRALARQSVFFGHQSVGMNLLDGLARLASESGVIVRIVESPGASSVPSATLGHAFIPENGDPLEKLRGFSRALSAPAPGLDVALLKFCYVDFGPATNAKDLFAAYQKTLADLATAHPRVMFVHVTAPLTTVQDGPKAWLKRIMGRAPAGLVENARREEYNMLLRAAYQGREPIFDLARLESTRPDGMPETHALDGKAIPTLVAAYTDDGGHLNLEGQTRAARELLSVLAAVPRRGSVGDAVRAQ